MRRKLAQTCVEPKPTDQRTADGPAAIAAKAAKEGAAAAAAAAAAAEALTMRIENTEAECVLGLTAYKATRRHWNSAHGDLAGSFSNLRSTLALSIW